MCNTERIISIIDSTRKSGMVVTRRERKRKEAEMAQGGPQILERRVDMPRRKRMKRILERLVHGEERVEYGELAKDFGIEWPGESEEGMELSRRIGTSELRKGDGEYLKFQEKVLKAKVKMLKKCVTEVMKEVVMPASKVVRKAKEEERSLDNEEMSHLEGILSGNLLGIEEALA